MDTLQEDENLVRCLKSNEYLVQEPLMHIYMELVILENRQAWNIFDYWDYLANDSMKNVMDILDECLGHQPFIQSPAVLQDCWVALLFYFSLLACLSREALPVAKLLSL